MTEERALTSSLERLSQDSPARRCAAFMIEGRYSSRPIVELGCAGRADRQLGLHTCASRRTRRPVLLSCEQLHSSSGTCTERKGQSVQLYQLCGLAR